MLLIQSYTVKHFMARAVCLIAIPAALYMGIFYIHLAVLNHSGPGDGFYSSAFQVSLKGNYLHASSTPKGKPTYITFQKETIQEVIKLF